MDEREKILTDMFKDRDWFDSVGYDQYGRVVVYVKYMCHETLYDIPDTCEGKQVLSHFASSKNATREQFTNTQKPATLPVVTPAPKLELVDEPEIEELDSSFLETDLSELCKALDKLERICGSNCLQDIFYEVHDGKNAVTNLSVKYPEVRAKLEQLYDEYGFDVIYEELDG